MSKHDVFGAESKDLSGDRVHSGRSFDFAIPIFALTHEYRDGSAQDDCCNWMRLIVILCAFLLLSCSSDQHDIDRGIAEMEGEEVVEQEDTTNVLETCLFDTSYYKLTMAALAGIPDAKDVRWIESEHSAVVNWRGDEVRRSRGGCNRFADNLEYVTRDVTSLEDALHWLEKAKQVTAHFGIPYFPKAIADGKAKFDPTMSDAETKSFRLDIEPIEDRLIEGFTIRRVGDRTLLKFEQYQI